LQRKRGRVPKEDRRQWYIEKYGTHAVDIMTRVIGTDLSDVPPKDFETALTFEETQRGRLRK